MGIHVEFNPDLCLRAFGTEGREPEECLPPVLEKGFYYPFKKEGQRNYWLKGEIPLRETKGNEELSRPLASVRIIKYTHELIKDIPYTWGTYTIRDVYDLRDPTIHFEGFTWLR